MSSDLHSSILAIQQNNYLSLAILTAVGYDYLLVLPSEIEYIWNKQWSWVSTMFLLVRYCGLLNVMYSALMGSSFFPGPTKACKLFSISGAWIYIPFIAAADFVMILRVWAMYSQSNPILGILLITFFVEIISIVVVAVYGSSAKYDSWVAIQVLDYSYCTQQNASFPGFYVAPILQMVFAVVLCGLAIAMFVKQSRQMHNITKLWQPSRYMNLLVNQGMLYFSGIFLMNLISVMYNANILGTGWVFILANILQIVPVYTLTPRFIISVRELYARDVQGRHMVGVDTGFGFTMLSSRSIVGGPIVFAADVWSEMVEPASESVEEDEGNGKPERGIEEIPMQVWSS